MAMGWSRRAMLRGAATMAAGSGLRDVRAQQGGSTTESPIRLGMASYTFRTFDRAKLIGCMQQLRLRDLNLKDVHLPMGTPDEVRAGAAALRAAGMRLTAVGTVTFNKDDDADMRAKFDYARAAGVPVIVAAPTKEVLPRLERFVREYDLKIAIHNHGPEDKVFPSPLDVLAAVQGMDARIGCCVDVGHCTRAGVDPVAAIRTVGARVYDVHMKDLANRTEKESQVAVGEGLMPVREIFAALMAAGYKGCVDLEYEIHEDDPMPGVVESVAFERGVLRGMGYRTPLES